MKKTKFVVCATALFAVASLGVAHTPLVSSEAVAAPAPALALALTPAAAATDSVIRLDGPGKAVVFAPYILLATKDGSTKSFAPGSIVLTLELPGPIEDLIVDAGWKAERKASSASKSTVLLTNTQPVEANAFFHDASVSFESKNLFEAKAGSTAKLTVNNPEVRLEMDAFLLDRAGSEWGSFYAFRETGEVIL